jgi:hypothetical protein
MQYSGTVVPASTTQTVCVLKYVKALAKQAARSENLIAVRLHDL